jgi:hypothetical protein
MAAVLLDMAVDETQGPAPFDVAGLETVELGDLARLVAEQLEIARPAIERATPTGGAGDHYVGDGQRYMAALSHTPIGLDRIVSDTIAYLLETGAIN